MMIIDLSQPIFDGCPNCPDHPPVVSEIIADHPHDGWRMELLTLTSHTGSHIDAPLHRISGGADLDALPLERFVGLAQIADLRGIRPATPISDALLNETLGSLPPDLIVLLATGWGRLRAKNLEWERDSPFLAPEGAEWLVKRKVRAVGIDHYSIGGSRDSDNRRTHETLLANGIWVVEELNFPDTIWVIPQPFEFWALPINLRHHSGAFCRPVALERSVR